MKKRIVTNIVNINNLKKKPCESWLNKFDNNGEIDAHTAFIEYCEEYEWLYKHSNYDLIAWEIENNCFNWKKNSEYVARFCPDKLDADRYNWKEDSEYVAKYCPDKLDPYKFNWSRHSCLVAQFCPDKIDPDKFNWKNDSWAVEIFCPDKLKLKPEIIRVKFTNRTITNIININELYNLPCGKWADNFKNDVIDAHIAFIKYGEYYGWLYENSNYDLIAWEIENDCFDWYKYSKYVSEYCPYKFDPNRYNWEDHSWVVAKFCPDKLDTDKFNWKEDSWAIVQYCSDKFDPDKYNWSRYGWAVSRFCPEKLVKIN